MTMLSEYSSKQNVVGGGTYLIASKHQHNAADNLIQVYGVLGFLVCVCTGQDAPFTNMGCCISMVSIACLILINLLEHLS